MKAVEHNEALILVDLTENDPSLSVEQLRRISRGTAVATSIGDSAAELRDKLHAHAPRARLGRSRRMPHAGALTSDSFGS